MLFYYVTAEYVISTHPAIISSLRGGVTLIREAQGIYTIIECIFLLDTEPWFMVIMLILDLNTGCSCVTHMHGPISVQYLTHDQQILSATDRVRYIITWS